MKYVRLPELVLKIQVCDKDIKKQQKLEQKLNHEAAVLRKQLTDVESSIYTCLQEQRLLQAKQKGLRELAERMTEERSW